MLRNISPERETSAIQTLIVQYLRFTSIFQIFFTNQQPRKKSRSHIVGKPDAAGGKPKAPVKSQTNFGAFHMKKNLSCKPARATQKTKFEMSPAMQARMEKAMISIGNVAGKQARKDDKVPREARLAIAETFDAWFDWLEDEAPDQIEEMFFEMGCFATATNRRRMFKHAKAPEGVAERVQEQVDQWKGEEEAGTAAAAKAATYKTDGGRNTPRTD